MTATRTCSPPPASARCSDVLCPTLLNKQLGQVLAGMFPGESANPRDLFVRPLGRQPGPVALAVTGAWSSETLLQDSQTFADRVRQAGTDVRADLFPGQHTPSPWP